MKTREKFTGVNSIEFYKHFQSDEDCYKYIADIKWKNGYVCKRCNNTTYCNGKKPYSK
ncbi:MAG: transposase, partial [Prevotellaceae bacterium]|nr:transposase [Prevotellaceae bacterium]